MKGELVYKLQLYYKDEYIRLFQGDCLEVMDKLIEKNIKVDAIITDPPYGTTACKWDSVIPFNEMWLRLEELIKDNGAIILTASQPFTSALVMSNPKLFKYEWIWEKDQGRNFQLAKKQPLKITESVLIFYKSLPTYNPQGLIKLDKPIIKSNKFKGGNLGHCSSESKRDTYTQEYTNYPKNLIKFNSERGLHPTQKPISLMEYMINTYTNENELILDFTCGSGSTLVAAKNLKRKCIGIELEEKYCEIAKNRLTV